MTRITTIITIASMTMLGAAGCGGEEPPAGETHARKMQRATRAVDFVLDRIDATQDQRTRVHQIKTRLGARARGLGAAHEQTRARLLAQWNSPRPDRKAVHAIVDGQIDLLRAFAHVVVDRAVDVHGLLTPEQRRQLAQMATTLRDRHHRRCRGLHGALGR